MNLGLAGKACVVNGGSRGIGLETAKMLCAEDAAVLLLARGEEALRSAAEECAAAGGRVEWLALDATAPDAGERVVEECERRFGSLDVLVNNSGTSSVTPLEELTDEDWELQWQLSVLGPMRLMRAAAPKMAERGYGRIVNVASSAGKRPSSTNMAYAVGKAAQRRLRSWPRSRSARTPSSAPSTRLAAACARCAAAAASASRCRPPSGCRALTRACSSSRRLAR